MVPSVSSPNPSSIRQKLLAMSMATSALAVSVTVLIFIGYGAYSARDGLVKEMTLAADIISGRAGPSLEWGDKTVAQQSLDDLKAKRSIRLACIYTTEGEVYAAHPKDAGSRCPPVPGMGVLTDGFRSLAVHQPIEFFNEIKGSLYIRSDLKDIWDYFIRFLGFISIALVPILGFAYLLSVRKQKSITAPIIHLMEATKTVQRGDYSVRAIKETDDEIGALTESFNHMMRVAQDAKENLEKKVEEKTHTLKDALDAAELARMEAERANALKDEWIQNIGHELRTPLHGIMNFADMGREDTKEASVPRDEIVHYFKRIHTSSQRLRQLIDDLLDFGKMTANKMHFEFKPACLLTIAKQTGKEIEGYLLKKHLRFDIDTPPFDTEVECDERWIFQVITNLISNAIKFSPESETIRLTFDRCTLPRGDTQANAIKVTITDRGIGIPAGEEESIFETFKQSSNTADGSGGTGLGLSIARQVILAHQGIIYAENNAGGPGATFTFILPCRHSDEESADLRAD